ncbi:heparin lyase I family protein [Celeribacter halophilus]|uniref:Polysaccharide lyase n=1 Tax=Celeribacter halophilus TaxID=576117 RepID=A0A1I3WY46_9RHOB|nr:heparin lyase I family protein [Celeribacter halophilus]PZX04491.1 polysaccharide lyase-like protein [Celeribacter halophilus]SFK12293.1 Polysaccharide lyase [Celeribacter halophilus]
MPSDTNRQVTGTFETPDGEVFKNKTVTWYRSRRKVVAQGSTVIVDDPFRVTTDENGYLDVTVKAGSYLLMVKLKDADRYFNVTVPDSEGPHDFAACLDYEEVDDATLTQIQALVQQAIDAANRSEEEAAKLVYTYDDLDALQANAISGGDGTIHTTRKEGFSFVEGAASDYVISGVGLYEAGTRFSSLDALKKSVSGGVSFSIGTVVTAGRQSYIYHGIGTSIEGLDGWSVISPERSFSKSSRLTNYDDTRMALLDFENATFWTEREDPLSGRAEDYLTCTRSGNAWAFQPDGTIVTYGADIPVIGALGDDFGLIRLGNEKNWALNSYDPASWTDANGIMSAPEEFHVFGHDFVVLSGASSSHKISTGVDLSAGWSSGDVIPVRFTFSHGPGERFRAFIEDTASGDIVQVSVSGPYVNVNTETLGAVSNQVLRNFGNVSVLEFYLTLSSDLSATDVEISVGTGVGDTTYKTFFSGVDFGSSGDVLTSPIKTTTAVKTNNRDVVMVRQDLLNDFSAASSYVSFEIVQKVSGSTPHIEFSDGSKSVLFRSNEDGTYLTVDGGSSNLITGEGGGEVVGTSLVRGYFGERHGMSCGGQPVYSKAASSDVDYQISPNEIYIGSATSGASGVVRRVKLARGRVDTTPSRITASYDFYDPQIERAGYEKMISSGSILSGANGKPLQFLGDYPLEHTRHMAEPGDEVTSSDLSNGNFRSELSLGDSVPAAESFISYEFILAVEPHTAIGGAYPFFVCLQLKDEPDLGETGSSPVLALRVENAETYRLQTRTSAVDDVGAGTTPSPVIEYEWDYEPWEAHHIVLDFKDGRGEDIGLVRMWLNGRLVVNEEKVTGYNNDNEAYLKWGVYAGNGADASGKYASHFMNMRIRRDGRSWAENPFYELPNSAKKYPITLMPQEW